MEKSKKQIIDLLQSGDFTIIYWDKCEATLYEKKWRKEEEFLRDDYETMNKFIVNYTDWNDGYCPYIVELLSEALGGLTDSI